MDGLHILLVVSLLAFFGFRFVRSRMSKVNIRELIEAGAKIVDVRTPEEFASGHSEGAVNIPLQALPSRASELQHDQAIILCCLSGARSSNAVKILEQQGFSNVFNAGSWKNTKV